MALRPRRIPVCLVCALLIVDPASAAESWRRGSFTQLIVDGNFSSYRVEVNGTAWLGGGRVGIHCQGQYFSTTEALSPMPPLVIDSGVDPALGDFDYIQQKLATPVQGCEVTVSIRFYSALDSFEFRAEFPATGMSNISAAPPVVYDPKTRRSSWGDGPLPLATEFPSFDLPGLGYLNTHGNSLGHNFDWSRNGGLDKWAALVGIGLQAGPLLLYRATHGDDMDHPPATMLAPLTHMKSVVASTHDTGSGGSGALSVGVSGYVTELPNGFVQRVGLCGRRGINAAYRAWGDSVQMIGSTERLTLDEDPYNRKITYWTDNGAYYCYCGRERCNSCPDQHTPMGEILSQLQAYHKSLGLSIDMYHLDSGFWHSQNPLGHCNGVTASIWEASPYHFPEGLRVFNSSFQMLFMLLAGPDFKTDLPGGNWYDREGWPMEASDEDQGGVGMTSQVLPSRSRAFWEEVFGARYSDSSLRALVIDTLQVWFLGYSSRINNTVLHDQWLDGYLGTASRYKMPIRIDQSLPSDHMASAEHSWAGVVSARCGGDMDGGNTWTQMASTGAFLSALNIRPIMDVLWTSPVQPGNYEHLKLRPDIEHELVIAVLTTGPVGFGDMLNGTNKTRLDLASRSDGVILKPVYPALRLDSFYTTPGFETQELWAAPSVPAYASGAAVQTDRRANSFVRLVSPTKQPDTVSTQLWWWNILATNVPGSASRLLRIAELWPTPHASASFLVAKWGSPCRNNTPAAECLRPFNADAPLPIDTPSSMPGSSSLRGWALYSAAPVLDNGWAIIGEESKYVRMSPQRLASAHPSTRGENDSDSFAIEEVLETTSNTLSFDVSGMPGEEVKITLVTPTGARANNRQTRSGHHERENAIRGSICIVALTLPASGRVGVTHSIKLGTTFRTR